MCPASTTGTIILWLLDLKTNGNNYQLSKISQLILYNIKMGRGNVKKEKRPIPKDTSAFFRIMHFPITLKTKATCSQTAWTLPHAQATSCFPLLHPIPSAALESPYTTSRLCPSGRGRAPSQAGAHGALRGGWRLQNKSASTRPSLSSPLLQPKVAPAFHSSISEHVAVPQTTAAGGAYSLGDLFFVCLFFP